MEIKNVFLVGLFVFCWPIASVLSECTTGWFGDNCQYKCHCTDNNCDDNGLCLTNSTCTGGWFGPLCQYYDIAPLGSTITSNVTDGDDSTCVLIQNFTISWSIRQVLTSVRLKYQKNDPVSNISLAVKESNFASSFTPCTNQTMSRVNDFTIDIYCSYSKTVQAVTVDFGKSRSACTVNVSGGRNIALKQPTWQSSDYVYFGNVLWHSSKAVDGKTDSTILHNSCTHTNESTPGTWRVTFPQPLNVNRYILYNRDVFQNRLSGLKLISYSSSNQPLFTYTDPYTVASVYTVTSPLTPFVTYVQINVTDVLTLCEVEIFEVCPIGWFGPNCQYQCHCTNYYCDVYGGCYGGSTCVSGLFGPLCQYLCDDHHYGPNCLLNCSSTCGDSKCNITTGECSTCVAGFQGTFCNISCDPHHFGPNCAYNCSHNCEKSECNEITGECYSCVAGFNGRFCNVSCDSQHFGPNCAYNCLPICDKSECNKITGYCNLCKAGYQGDFCNSTCDKSHYGPGCIYNCSANCDKSECDKTNGRCSTCLPGYTGDFCNAPVQNSTNGNSCYIDIRFNNCTKEYLAESCNHCQDRLAEGIGIGIGIMCAAVVIITAIACILRKYVPSLACETDNQNIVNGQILDSGKLTESQTVYTDLDVQSSTVELNPYDTIQKESSPYDSLDTECKESVQYESAGL